MLPWYRQQQPDVGILTQQLSLCNYIITFDGGMGACEVPSRATVAGHVNPIEVLNTHCQYLDLFAKALHCRLHRLVLGGLVGRHGR